MGSVVEQAHQRAKTIVPARRVRWQRDGLLVESDLCRHEVQSWERLSVAATVPGEQGQVFHQGVGPDQEVGQDHLAGATTLAVVGMGSGGKEGRLPRDGPVVVEVGWQERIQRFDALAGKADPASASVGGGSRRSSMGLR